MLLEIPAGALVILCGPAGAGKSSFAHKHFRPSQVVSSDHCREMIADDPANQSVSHLAFDLLHQIVRYRLVGRRLTVVDSTALEKDARKDLRRIAHELGSACLIVLFDIDLEECIKRNAKRAKRVVEESVVIQQWNAFQENKDAIAQEGYDRVYILEDMHVDAARVVLR
jgi:protein phosphatase